MQTAEVKSKIKHLISKYDEIKSSGLLKKYNEAQTRNEFIEPLFEYLGWDMRSVNNQGEVTTEESISGGRIDLSFKINGIPKFYLEAKSLSTDLDVDKHAKQAVNYSWNKGVTWAVLTDFESVKVLNAQTESKNLFDKLVFEIPCAEFIDDYDRLQLLSRESFKNNALDKYAEKYGKLQKHLTVNEKLFTDLKLARYKLTESFKTWNDGKNITPEELDEGVQRVLDRLIFIRVLEDRNLEPPILKPLLRKFEENNQIQIFQLLVKTFRELDATYNSNLFQKHACEEWEEYSHSTKEVIEMLYGNEMLAYDFKQIPADILGGVYESYLGHISKKRSGDLVKSATKRKEHGIYYTPKYIVDYIVNNTVKDKLKTVKSIGELKRFRVCDPAC
ncbi:hypothetical protein A2215_03170 [Candidatus Berkelbacteria bacterium RIFOXYA2_FULL_43_10]|uniref:site-specific DNA-methyltransferase (adenine-specific) n=1 Tax=Candidatus Berkelbacteria bacterium RIFOXYA2_FULL_43_10 TaxID=1797472 RepID=A0A1F5EDV2_9BACT|nr:MAG: hypothetical protein A2215_03170 [Candidatus Berkelbacteria bacterium RIFOXYA2_FULL_43_10]